MRLTKPINQFTDEEVMQICEFVRNAIFIHTGQYIEIKTCPLDYMTCHFSISDKCPKKRSQANAM